MLNVKTYLCLHNKFSNIVDGGMAIEAINILIARFEVYETSLVVWDEEVQHKSHQRPDPPSAHTRVTSTFSDISQFQQQSQISFTDSSLSHEKKEDKKRSTIHAFQHYYCQFSIPPESLYKFTKSKLTGQGYLNEKAWYIILLTVLNTF